MTASLAPRTSSEPTLSCGNCRQPMQRLVLPGHYGRSVEIDLCPPCHLVWFDLTETARLTGPALLELIGTMAQAQALPHEVLRRDARCVRCAGGLKTVHNRSRWGESLQLECLNRHGAFQSFAQFLQEKGLLRPMSRLDRTQLLQRDGRIDCVNCGAAIGADEAHCSHCRSVPSLLDVARLARALDPEGVLEPQAVHAAPAQQAALQCAACGAALPPGRSLGCAQCGATLAVSRLAEAHASVEALGPALRAHAEKPAPAVVKRRLDALAADIPRRREWAAKMEAEAAQARGAGDIGDEADWRSLLELKTNPLRAVLLALVIWFVWWFW
jgi:Zn-finger nucleic acid-binding protein/predicted nucleic acid-binding Zn ribbon protein